jgi:predicted S18 family serine protease
MLPRPQMKKLMVATTVATLLASPAFAQSYSAAYGTGNMINQPLAELSNGAAGIGATAYNDAGIDAKAQPGSAAYAYVPRPKHDHTGAKQSLFDRAKGNW